MCLHSQLQHLNLRAWCFDTRNAEQLLAGVLAKTVNSHTDRQGNQWSNNMIKHTALPDMQEHHSHGLSGSKLAILGK